MQKTRGLHAVSLPERGFGCQVIATRSTSGITYPLSKDTAKFRWPVLLNRPGRPSHRRRACCDEDRNTRATRTAALNPADWGKKTSIPGVTMLNVDELVVVISYRFSSPIAALIHN